MKIKIIDLLNLVYEKKAPKQVLYKYCEYEFNSVSNDYENNDGLELFSYLFQNEEQVLWLEVEIIEERPKEIELLELGKVTPNGEYIISENDEKIQDKINEIIKEINLLKKEDSK